MLDIIKPHGKIKKIEFINNSNQSRNVFPFLTEEEQDLAKNREIEIILEIIKKTNFTTSNYVREGTNKKKR